MRDSVAALARKHGLSLEAASEFDALVTASASLGGASVESTQLRSVGPDPTVFLWAGPPSARSAPSEVADRYQVVGALGRGGMGEVQRVVDRWLNRVVARKVMHATLSEGARARFLEEAQATAQLQHPGIAPVYDLGTDADGRLWFTMKEVQGETLRAEIRACYRSGARGGGSTEHLRRLMTIFVAVCRAVGFAHERGVVHRDLKPSNVMVGRHGEVVVVDWGIAKVLSALGSMPGTTAIDAVYTSRGNLEHTQAGTVTGTPAFMSPEQARGEGHAVDARSDVYSLGAILYEILSGTAPYRGEGPSVLAQVREGPPPSLRGPAGAGGLATAAADGSSLVEICERAMARAPDDRFPGGSALADAVQSWLDGHRRREVALGVVAEAAAQRPAAAALRARAVSLRAEAAAALAGVDAWRPEEDKAAAWAKEDEATDLEGRASLAEIEEESLLRASLTHAPDLLEAHAALTERYRAEHAALEARREPTARPERWMRQHLAALPDDHPVRRHGVAYLQGDGALTLLTDPPGAEVSLFRHEIRNRRLVAVWDRDLGRTPLRRAPLPMGSWLCVLRHPGRAPVRYPVVVGRGEHWDGVPPEGGDALPVRLPTVGSLGPEDCYVPAGWHWSGDAPAAPGVLPRRRVWLDALVVRRFPVRNREYLAFLHALVAAGREADALRHAPRVVGASPGEVGALIHPFEGGRFSLGRDALGADWDPEWPVTQVDWAAARAFAAWEAERTGAPWSLPEELAWEKAARGVDGRRYPWGDRTDPSWACLMDSHRSRPLPAVVDSFPVDESVYGVRGLGGNVRDWCADGWRSEGPTVLAGGRAPRVDPGGEADAVYRVTRGGCWRYGSASARATLRDRDPATNRAGGLGVRLARWAP